MMAIQRGTHVYVEKPLTHAVGEARALRAAVQKHKVISQIGNQGRATHPRPFFGFPPEIPLG